MRQPAGQMAQCLQLLRACEELLRALLFGDVERQLEAAGKRAVGRPLGNQRGTHGAPVAGAGGEFVLEAQRFAGHGTQHVRLDHRIHRVAQKRPGTGLFGPRGVDAEPVVIAPVDVAVDAVAVEVGHQRRNRVHHQAHALLAAGQFRGARGDAVFEVGAVLANRALGLALRCHIGIEGDEAMPRQRLAMDVQHATVRADALDVVRREGAGCGQALGHQHLGIARAVFAAAGVVANEGLERRAEAGHALREIEQAHVGAVPGHQAQLGVEDRQPLVEQVESGLQGLVARERSCGGQNVVSLEILEVIAASLQSFVIFRCGSCNVHGRSSGFGKTPPSETT